MCRAYHGEHPDQYRPQTRAIRLNGYATSIRLEEAFWHRLDMIATHEGMTLNRFVSLLHEEIVAERGNVKNFASLLRVICLRWSEPKEHLPM